eukprot:3707777-Prymnesium_polylepis.1
MPRHGAGCLLPSKQGWGAARCHAKAGRGVTEDRQWHVPLVGLGVDRGVSIQAGGQLECERLESPRRVVAAGGAARLACETQRGVGERHI